MTRDEIVRLAQKAGFSISGSRRINVGPQSSRWIIDDEITRFASLMAVAAAAVEREACAKVCDSLASPSRLSDPSRSWITGTLDCASAIRARSKE